MEYNFSTVNQDGRVTTCINWSWIHNIPIDKVHNIMLCCKECNQFIRAVWIGGKPCVECKELPGRITDCQ